MCLDMGVGEIITFSYGFWGARLKQWDYCLQSLTWYSWRSHPDHSKTLWDKVSTGALKSYQSNHKSLQMFGFTRTGTPIHGSVWSNVLQFKGNCTFLLLSYFVKTFTPYQVNGLTYDLFTKTLTPSRASGLTFWPPRAHQCCLIFDSDSWPNLSV